MDSLQALYDKVSVGGYVIIDDYSLIPSCKAAVDTFRAERGISCEINQVDADSILWKKSEQRVSTLPGREVDSV